MTLSDTSTFTFFWIVPSQESRDSFALFESAVLDTLMLSYGDTSYSQELHLRRLLTEQQHLCMAIDSFRQNNVAACSYVRVDGKRGATAVRPEYRGIGLGTALVKETLQRIPHQFGEIDIENRSHILRLKRLGFSQVNDVGILQHLLSELWFLVTEIKTDENGLVYRRKSRDNQGLTHHFVALSTFKS
jgi:GNAT superfamily N-acetyltransferase